MASYWLVKSEPSVCSIEMMEKAGVTLWEGVRNYQARNFLKEMEKGDEVLFYHSSEEPIGVAGIVKVEKTAYPDPTQFDKKSEYFDGAATKDAPRWFCPDMKFVKKFSEVIPLGVLKKEKQLKEMVLLQKGSRLSVQKVTKEQFSHIVALASKKLRT